MKNILLILSGFLLSFCTQKKNDTDCLPLETQPVFKVDYGTPTADKPQSKLWFADNCWWAILPDSTGPTLWQRTKDGWISHPEIAEKLQRIPGRADVWPEENQVTAVGVGDSSLTVFRLIKEPGLSNMNWSPEILKELFPPSPSPIETATIARDGDGNWWVAATAGKQVCTWFSSDNGKNWAKPYILGGGISKDDICVVTPLKSGVGIIWSDQLRDAVLMRVHKDGNPAETWENEEIIDSGNKTADDHLNTVLTKDGTLWLASKNSVDKIGKPQFVLRVRSVDGKWVNKPYCVLENDNKRPSRPIVVAVEDNSHLFLGHGILDRSTTFPYRSNITFAVVDTTASLVFKNKQIVVAPPDSANYMVHNVTGPRFPFPANAPWIVLASDTKGQVFEADLKEMMQK